MHLSVLGISSEFLDVYSIGKNGNFPLKLTKRLVSDLRVPDNNVEKVCSNMMVVAGLTICIRHMKFGIEVSHKHTHTVYMKYRS